MLAKWHTLSPSHFRLYGVAVVKINDALQIYFRYYIALRVSSVVTRLTLVRRTYLRVYVLCVPMFASLCISVFVFIFFLCLVVCMFVRLCVGLVRLGLVCLRL